MNFNQTESKDLIELYDKINAFIKFFNGNQKSRNHGE